MKTIGLTGGVGMGKSTAASLLRSRGFPVIDTDDVARKLVEPGQPALAEIRQLFGSDILGPDGRLRRGELARLVFSNSAKRGQLEGILHPRIRQVWKAQRDSWCAEGGPIAVVVIPLLFETDAHTELDATICVACSSSTQLERLKARGWSPEHIYQRIHAQWPVEKKMNLANYVIWSEGSVDIHAAQLDLLLRRLQVS